MPWAPEWAKERDRQLRAKLELARAQRDGYLSQLQAAENRSALFKFGLLDEAANTRHALHEVNQALGDMPTARQALQIATNAMDRLANAIGMEHGAVETEDGTSRLAIVQWTHTLRMRPMLLAARRQILQRRQQAEHHVVLSSCGEAAPSCAELLTAARPLSENVTCATGDEVAASFEAFRSVADVYHNAGIHANWTIGTRSWCWESCDAPYVHWYATVGHRLRHVRYFWFLEWDVVWTGSIVTLLDAWSGRMPETTDGTIEPPTPYQHLQPPGGARSASPDLLCPNPSKVLTRWKHRFKRDTHAVNFTVTFKCVTEVFRLSHRLLESMVAFSRVHNHAMFCEMRAATVCATRPWCRMRSLFDAEHAHLLHTKQRSVSKGGAHAWAASKKRLDKVGTNYTTYRKREQWTLSYLHDGGVEEEQLARNLDEEQLFHAYKWNNSVPLGDGVRFDAERYGFGALLRSAGQLACERGTRCAGW